MLATLALLVLAALPLGLMLVGPLEDRFVANPALPDRVDGIVVLGGAADEALSMARGQLVLGDAAERLLAFVALARRYPAADLIVSRGANGEGFNSDARTAWPAGFFADSVSIRSVSAMTAGRVTLPRTPFSAASWPTPSRVRTGCW